MVVVHYMFPRDLMVSWRLVDWNQLKKYSHTHCHTWWGWGGEGCNLFRSYSLWDQDPELFAVQGSCKDDDDGNSIWSPSINGMRQPVDGFSHAQVDDICLIDARQQQSAPNEGCNKINIVIYSCCSALIEDNDATTTLPFPWRSYRRTVKHTF